MRIPVLAAAVSAAVMAGPALADTAPASCEIYPAGSDTLDRMVPCTFSQRQGYIDIVLEDGTEYDLEPVGDEPGNFRDQDGREVYRQSGLGDQGVIFRMPDISIFLYWQTGAEGDGGANEATAPFTTDDYDATTILRCQPQPDADFGDCPAGIARMEDGQASITVQGTDGAQFTMNFMNDYATGEPYVNAADHEVEAVKSGDMWTVTLDGTQVYQVPEAALTGG